MATEVEVVQLLRSGLLLWHLLPGPVCPRSSAKLQCGVGRARALSVGECCILLTVLTVATTTPSRPHFRLSLLSLHSETESSSRACLPKIQSVAAAVVAAPVTPECRLTVVSVILPGSRCRRPSLSLCI